MKNAIIYLNPYSIELPISKQRDIVTIFCDSNNIEIKKEIIEETTHEFIYDRKQGKIMLDLLSQETNIDFIVTPNFNAMTKNVMHFGWIISHLKMLKKPVKLLSATERNDYDEDHIKLMLRMQEIHFSNSMDTDR